MLCTRTHPMLPTTYKYLRPFDFVRPFIHATGEDEQDNGMEMENDFEGEMFDVPKGEEKDQDAEDDAEEKEELDREMGDLGDDADVVDMKLWDEDDEDDDADGKEQGEEKFESG